MLLYRQNITKSHPLEGFCMGKNEKQGMIIDAALEVFRQKGYANARMADIAKKAGVSYGLVYHYFGSKEVLFDIIVESWWSALYSTIEKEITSSDPIPDKLTNIIKFFLDTYGQKPNLMSIFVSEVSRSSVYHTEEGLSKFMKFFNLCEEIMAQGQQNGFLSKEVSPHHLTYIFYGSIETFISVMVLGKEPLTKKRQERATNAILHVFIDGARAR
jgi:TetR/AcrR family transcriptional regulator, fatty acid metabolism regulator protein